MPFVPDASELQVRATGRPSQRLPVASSPPPRLPTSGMPPRPPPPHQLAVTGPSLAPMPAGIRAPRTGPNKSQHIIPCPENCGKQTYVRRVFETVLLLTNTLLTL